jgi:hypothetical protein
MPRKDPATGCTVMTSLEFFQSEAQREGKETHEVIEEFFDGIDADNRRVEEEYRNPEVALKTLKESMRQNNEALAGDNQPLESMPVRVVEVLECESQQSSRGTGLKIVARAEDEQGRVRKISYWSAHDFGTYLDPPDYDENCQWEEA